jgi:hypothetical protein
MRSSSFVIGTLRMSWQGARGSGNISAYHRLECRSVKTTCQFLGYLWPAEINPM